METRMLSCITEGVQRDVEILGDAETMAIGGVADVLTWLRWFRENRDVFLGIQGFLSEFVNATTWSARLAVIGRAIDALKERFVTAPVTIDAQFVALGEEATDGYLIPEATQAEEWGATEAAITALRIDWGGVLARLPQLITFVQTVAELIRRFQSQAATAAGQFLNVHGFRYQPLAIAA